MFFFSSFLIREGVTTFPHPISTIQVREKSIRSHTENLHLDKSLGSYFGYSGLLEKFPFFLPLQADAINT